MQTWHHVLRKSLSASMKSNTCEDEARFTAQVRPKCPRMPDAPIIRGSLKSVVFLKGQPVARAEGGPGRRANLKINHLVCGGGPNRPYMLAITTTSERIGHWIRMRRSLAPFSGLES